MSNWTPKKTNKIKNPTTKNNVSEETVTLGNEESDGMAETMSFPMPTPEDYLIEDMLDIEAELETEGDHVQLQGAEGGGVVAPGGEGGVGGGQGEGAGQGHHPKEEARELRADGGTVDGGVLHVGEEHLVQGGHVHASSGVTSRKPKPMYFKKKRGIVPDGLVQMRLSNFTKQFPNLQSTWAV